MFETAVVGWDGRPAADEAVRWVLRRPVAARTHLLRVVDDRRAHEGSPSPIALAAEAERALRDELDLLGRAHPALHLSGDVAVGDARVELERRTGPGALLVLGSDRAPAPAARWRWTEGAHIAARAHGPVVLVPPGAAARDGAVLVGVDGSAASLAAARRAAELAAASGTSLVVLHAWQSSGDPDEPAILARGTDGAGVDVDRLTDLLPARTLPSAHIALLRSAVATLRTEHPDLAVGGRLVHEATPAALQRWAEDASLLVVGRHSRWSSDAVLLGSVTHAMLLASPAPVLVVGRDDAPRPAEPVHAAEPAAVGAAGPVSG